MPSFSALCAPVAKPCPLCGAVTPSPPLMLSPWVNAFLSVLLCCSVPSVQSCVCPLILCGLSLSAPLLLVMFPSLCCVCASVLFPLLSCAGPVWCILSSLCGALSPAQSTREEGIAQRRGRGHIPERRGHRPRRRGDNKKTATPERRRRKGQRGEGRGTAQRGEHSRERKAPQSRHNQRRGSITLGGNSTERRIHRNRGHTTADRAQHSAKRTHQRTADSKQQGEEYHREVLRT
jgi:hypothetical protein